MLQTGGQALDDLVRGAKFNIGRQRPRRSSRRPKTLYLDSQDANMTMLQGPGEDPLALVASLVGLARAPRGSDSR